MKIRYLLILVVSIFIVGCQKESYIDYADLKPQNIHMENSQYEETEEIIEENIDEIDDETLKKELHILKDYKNKIVNSAFLDLYIYISSIDRNENVDYIYKTYLNQFRNDLNEEVSIDIYNKIEERYNSYIENMKVIGNKMLNQLENETLLSILLNYNKLTVLISNLDNEKRMLASDVRNEFKLLENELSKKNSNYNEILKEVKTEYETTREDKEIEFKRFVKNKYEEEMNKLYNNDKTSLVILTEMCNQELEKVGFLY